MKMKMNILMASNQVIHKTNKEKKAAVYPKKEKGKEEKVLVESISFELDDSYDLIETEELQKNQTSILRKMCDSLSHSDKK